MPRKTTTPGYEIPNGQVVVRPTPHLGTDRRQYVYVLKRTHRDLEYGANGSDIRERLCPRRQGGEPGLPIRD